MLVWPKMTILNTNFLKSASVQSKPFKNCQQINIIANPYHIVYMWGFDQILVGISNCHQIIFELRKEAMLSNILASNETNWKKHHTKFPIINNKAIQNFHLSSNFSQVKQNFPIMRTNTHIYWKPTSHIIKFMSLGSKITRSE